MNCVNMINCKYCGKKIYSYKETDFCGKCGYKRRDEIKRNKIKINKK